MKVRTFIQKYLFASSTAKFVHLADRVGHAISLPIGIIEDPMSKDHDLEALDCTVRSFQIKDDTLVIYHN